MQVLRPSWLSVSVAALLVSSLASSPAQGQEKAKLQLRLKAGQSYPLVMSLDQTINQTIAGNVQKITQSLGFTVTLKVAKLDTDGTIHGSFTYDAVRAKIDGPSMSIDYDSAKPDEAAAAGPANMMAKVFAAMIGKSLDVVMSSDGRVTDLKGADQLMDAVINSMELPEGARDAVVKQIKSQFGDEALKRGFEQMTAIYPKQPVAVGDTWSADQRMSIGFPMVVKTTYELKSLSGNKAMIDARGTMEAGEVEGEGQPPAAAAGAPVAKLKGTQTGSIAIDQDSGWIRSAEIKQDIKGTLSVVAGAQTLEIPMTINGAIRMGESTKATK